MMNLDPVKIVKCKECGVDVVVNAAYPITEVECRDWYCPKKMTEISEALAPIANVSQ